MFSLLGQIPFIGKHKRVLGTLLTVGGLVVKSAGDDALGQHLQDIGVAVLGVGVVHAEKKQRG